MVKSMDKSAIFNKKSPEKVFLSNHSPKTLGCDFILYAVWKWISEYLALVRVRERGPWYNTALI